ncbi:MAG: caspase family protein, partial [Clostridiales bacterium]|nr:caspase family protein [Clostridiales bacterium]
SLVNYDAGLFFFAGHGFQIDGNNFLGGTDLSFNDASSAKFTAFELKLVIDALEKSNLEIKIIIIDACREYFSDGGRGIKGGFAPMLAPKGTIIAFATSPGQIAKEKDYHGIYTRALLKHIETEKISIEDMFKRVRNTVYMETNGEQITWEHTSLMGNFKFNEGVIKKGACPYTELALADKDYEVEKSGLCKELIELALTHDWNYQNMIPKLLDKKRNQLKSESADDLFVLGRNIYQSSCDPYTVNEWCDKLHNNLEAIDINAAQHILCGMAYEIYFNSKGKLRERFKTMPCYKKVIQELSLLKYNDVRNFIAHQLTEYSQRVMYIPGGEQLQLEVYLKVDNTDKFLYIKEVLLDGLNIIYGASGEEFYEADLDYRFRYGNIECLIESLRKETASTDRGCNIKINTDARLDYKVKVPVYYKLLRYGYSIR